MKFCSFRDPPAAILVDGVNHSFWCNSGNTSFPIFKLLLLSFMFTDASTVSSTSSITVAISSVLYQTIRGMNRNDETFSQRTSLYFDSKMQTTGETG